MIIENQRVKLSSLLVLVLLEVITVRKTCMNWLITVAKMVTPII